MAKTEISAEALKTNPTIEDSRAAGYVSYYTYMGWTRWDMASQVIAQRVKEKQLAYREAVDLYEKEMAALQKRRQDLEKRLGDIAVKKATTQIRREDAEWKERNARLREEYKARVRQARDDAYVASSSYSHSWSQSHGTGSGAAVRSAGGRDALDESLDEVGADNGASAKQAVSGAVGRTTNATTGAAELRNIKALQNRGTLDNTQYGADVTLYAAHKHMTSKLAQTLNISEDAARSMLDAELNDAAITGQVNNGATIVVNRAQKGSGAADRESMSSSQSSSRGAYYKDYELPPMPELDKEKDKVDLKPLEEAEAKIKGDLEALSGIRPVKPILEPTDVITATRQEYISKFGDVPRGTSLQMGGETIGKYKELMPFELTNALGKVERFFKMYIQDEIQTASANGQLSTDAYNAAVERGKARAREILFGGLAARDPEYAATLNSATATAGAASAASHTPVPSDPKSWSDVGVTKPETGNPEADEAAYQKAKEDWVKAEEQKRKAETISPDVFDYNKPTTPVRASGILPFVDEAMAGVNAPLDLREAVDNLRAPPRTPSEYETFFRNRVGPTPAVAESPNVDIGAMLEAQRRRIESDDLRRRSMEGERRAPMIEGPKPEGEIGPIPAPPSPTPRPLGDILLRGFKPELERGTGRVIIPPMTPQQRQDAIVGMTSGADQARLFPESMTTSAPRTTSEGLSARPLGVNEVFPRPAPTTQPFVPASGAGIFAPSETLEDFKARKEAFDMLRNKEINPELKKKPEQGATLDQKDTKAKIEAVVAGTKLATENPAAAGRVVNKDAMGKYIAAAYDENKSKGPKAKPLGELTQTIIREYAGDAEKQKKAVEILSSLAALDTTSGKINA